MCDTDPDSVVKADGPEVAGRQTVGDRLEAGRTISGAERLYPPPSTAFREHGVVTIEALELCPCRCVHGRIGIHDN